MVIKLKIINFDNFQSFKNLKRDMGIVENEENLQLRHPNIYEYFELYRKIENGWKIFSEKSIADIYNYLKIQPNGTLVDNKTNQNMVLYMYIQSPEFEYKFHISNCKAIEEHGSKANRWTALKKDDDNNIFEAKCGIVITQREMQVCRYCLEKLNYKNYNYVSREEQDKIVKNFSLKEFYEEYESTFMYIPDNLRKEFQNFDEEYAMTYTDDWKKISREFREYKNWKCDKCGKDMSHDKFNLHVHHRDHNKRNNNYSNLMCLCRECHAKMPAHEHMNKSSVEQIAKGYFK